MKQIVCVEVDSEQKDQRIVFSDQDHQGDHVDYRQMISSASQLGQQRCFIGPLVIEEATVDDVVCQIQNQKKLSNEWIDQSN